MKFAWAFSGFVVVALGLSAGCGPDSSGPDAPPVPGILEVGSDDGEVVKIGGNYVLQKIKRSKGSLSSRVWLESRGRSRTKWW